MDAVFLSDTGQSDLLSAIKPPQLLEVRDVIELSVGGDDDAWWPALLPVHKSLVVRRRGVSAIAAEPAPQGFRHILFICLQ